MLEQMNICTRDAVLVVVWREGGAMFVQGIHLL